MELSEGWEVLKINSNYEINKEYPYDIRNMKTKYILNPGVQNDGYYYYILNGKLYTKHRTIAEQWIPNLEKLPQIDHINGIRTDDHIDNLRWVDNSANNTNRNSILSHNHTYLCNSPETTKETELNLIEKHDLIIGRFRDKDKCIFNKGIIATRHNCSARSILGGAVNSEIKCDNAPLKKISVLKHNRYAQKYNTHFKRETYYY